MKVIAVTASFGGTVNLGNYENFKVDVSLTAEIEDSDVSSPEEIARELQNTARELARQQVAALDSRNTRGWLRDTDLKVVKPASDAPALPGDDEEYKDLF